MTDDATTPRLGVLGGGVMGETVVSAALRAGWTFDDVRVVERSAVRANELSERYGVRAMDPAARVAGWADVVVVALKPHDVAGVLTEVSDSLRPGTLVVSVAAGLTCAQLEGPLPAGTPVVRVMPNTPAVIGRGASVVSAGTHAGEEHLALTERILAATGLVVRAPEKDLDAVTALSGSGPAYVFYLIDAMAEAGVLVGLTRDRARELAVATVEGAAAMVRETGEHPVVLRERVSSPGGTTVAGVRELDAQGVRAAVVAAVAAARDRSVELGAQGS
nr:pyrroline-5-carboxylate reductase [uncultured Cellulomonas sp.]